MQDLQTRGDMLKAQPTFTCISKEKEGFHQCLFLFWNVSSCAYATCQS